MDLKKRGKLWYLEARIKPGPGQPTVRHRISTGCEDKQDAERIAAKQMDELLAGTHSWRRQVPTFAEWWQTFFANAEGRIAQTTKDDWRRKEKVLVPVFGKMRLNAITRQHVEQFRDELLKKYKPGSVRAYCLLVMNVMNKAHEAKLIPESPVRNFGRKGTLPIADRRRRVLTIGEQQQLVAKLKEEMASPIHSRRMRATRLSNFIIIAIGTGLRIGTICQRLSLANVVKTADGLAIEIRSKGNKMHRIPVLPSVKAALESQAKITDHKEWLFDYTTLSMREQIHDLRERANVPHFTPHDLRRTFGTRLALGDKARGTTPVPLVVLKELMGHSAASITEQFYTVAEGDAVKSSFLSGAASGLDLGDTTPGTDSGTPA